MSEFLKFTGYIVAATGALVLRGWVISVLWLWFVVGAFNVPTINIPQGIGLGIIAIILCKEVPKDAGSDTYRISVAYCLPLVCLLIGWIVKQFM